MKLRHFLLIIPVVLMAYACQQEQEYAEDPVYDTMFFSADSIDFKSPIATKVAFDAGQKVYVGIAFAAGGEGKYIMRAEQTWLLTSDTNKEVIKDSKLVVGAAGKEPFWSFKAPMEPGVYKVTFKEKYSYSAQKATGQIFGESRIVTATFKVR
ncbi:MAG: hypothetical protein IK000_03020 [Bacteroidaceae bacterium]|nr:hypothetical protein [Bacteroidaceae bacterium]